MTVNQAIKEIFLKERRNLTVKEIYAKIIERKLYHFKSVTPLHIVATQLRRRCEGVNLKNSYKEREYKQLSDGTYDLSR